MGCFYGRGRLLNDNNWKYWTYPPQMREALQEMDRRHAREKVEREQQQLRLKREEEKQTMAWLCWAT